MSTADQCDLVLLPLPGAEPPAVDRAAVVEHLAARSICTAVLASAEIGFAGGLVVRVATTDTRVVVMDSDHAGSTTVHPGPELAEVVLGLAHRVGAAVHVDGVVADSSGRVLDDDRVLAGVDVSGECRNVAAWPDDDLLLAGMLAAELGEHGDAWLVDGWSITAWDVGAEVPADVLPLPRRNHPVVSVSRTGGLRSVVLTPVPGADTIEITWAPRPQRVLDAPDARRPTWCCATWRWAWRARTPTTGRPASTRHCGPCSSRRSAATAPPSSAR